MSVWSYCILLDEISKSETQEQCNEVSDKIALSYTNKTTTDYERGNLFIQLIKHRTHIFMKGDPLLCPKI